MGWRVGESADNLAMLCIKRFALAVAAAVLAAAPIFAGEYKGKFSVAFGLGSGYVSYGSGAAREFSGGDSSSVVVCGDVSAFIPLEKRVFVSLGADSVLDVRSGDFTRLLWDYAFLLGVRAYPNLAGLFAQVDYALGRRSDFEGRSLERNSSWGNGFRLGLGYDFSYHTDGIAPELGFSWRRMPRGDGADNLLSVRVRLKI